MINGKLSYYDIEVAYRAWRSYASTYNAYGSIKAMDELYHNIYHDYITEDKFWSY